MWLKNLLDPSFVLCPDGPSSRSARVRRANGWGTGLGFHRVLKEGSTSWDWCQAATVVGRSEIISVILRGVVSGTAVGLGVCPI